MTPTADGIADDAATSSSRLISNHEIAVEQEEPVIETVARMPDRAAGAGAAPARSITSMSRPKRAFSGVDAAYSTIRSAANPASSKTRVTPWRPSSNSNTRERETHRPVVMALACLPSTRRAGYRARRRDHRLSHHSRSLAANPRSDARGNSRSSTRPQIMCPAVIWICWISGVESEGASKAISQRAAISPPVLPVKPMVTIRCCRAASIARRMFGERPDVEIAMNTSPGNRDRGPGARTAGRSRNHCRSPSAPSYRW